MPLHEALRIYTLRVSPCKGNVFADSLYSPETWRIACLDKDGIECVPPFDHRCPEVAGATLYRLYRVQLLLGYSTSLRYADRESTAEDTTAAGFADRLAEVMWDHIEANEALPDHPEDYGPKADEHPIDALRTGFMTAAGII